MITTKEAVSTYVAAGAYALAALLFLFPILDALVAVVPMHPDEVAWRYNALDRLSQAVLPGLLGVLLAFCLALFLEQPRMVRATGVVSGAWAIVLLGVALLFIAASADVRAGSLARDKTAFDVATTIAVVKYAGGVLIAIAFAAPAWQAARRIRHEAHLMTPDLVEPPQFVMRPHGTPF